MHTYVDTSSTPSKLKPVGFEPLTQWMDTTISHCGHSTYLFLKATESSEVDPSHPMMINVSYYLDAFNEPRKLVVGKMKRERD